MENTLHSLCNHVSTANNCRVHKDCRAVLCHTKLRLFEDNCTKFACPGNAAKHTLLAQPDAGGITLATQKLTCERLAPASLPRLVLAQSKKDLLVNWWNEGKLEASEELGDLVSAAGDKELALKMYQLSGGTWLLAGTCCCNTLTVGVHGMCIDQLNVCVFLLVLGAAQSWQKES